jgi:protease I
MAKKAVVIGNLFEDSEYLKPAQAFKNAGFQVVHVGVKAGQTVKGIKEGTCSSTTKAKLTILNRYSNADLPLANRTCTH